MRSRLLACAALLGLSASPANSVRAALDFTFRINEGGRVQEITCDFCGHRFRDGTGKVFTLSVSAERGYVEVFFFDYGAPEASNWGPLIHSQEPVESSLDHFEVGYFQKARVREGQTLKLRGRSIEFTLVDAFGPGCPLGVQC